LDVTFEYDERTRTTLCRLAGDWNWETFYGTFEQQRASPTLNQSLNLIIDVTAVTAINTDAVLNLKRAAGWVTESQKRFYIVITNRYIRTIYYVFLRIYPDIAPRFFLVSTVDEARNLITKAAAD
jgi:hypothetical protein